MGHDDFDRAGVVGPAAAMTSTDSTNEYQCRPFSSGIKQNKCRMNHLLYYTFILLGIRRADGFIVAVVTVTMITNICKSAAVTE